MRSGARGPARGAGAFPTPPRSVRGDGEDTGGRGRGYASLHSRLLFARLAPLGNIWNERMRIQGSQNRWTLTQELQN